ncbi:uncharacterized protein LOC118300879 [Scophthalmus maximus]|uniref:uncharacterized protein LOC118300879 n=1 Tax=Scophthalmus maximus TaxID=52904 RepID=UPI001FA8B79D|nr:uncharacterized protein LOC118300879 [Scophthalmus maximus]
MTLLLSSLLLASLCAILSWSVSSTDLLVLTQTPDMSVTEGETVIITCCYTGESERITFNWQKNQTEIKNQSINLKIQSQDNLKNVSHYCSNLTLSNITGAVSGSYVCKVSVDIPNYGVNYGNPTVITVVARGSTDRRPDHPTQIHIILAVAVVVLLLLITLGSFCALRNRRANAARVIIEVPHIESEEVEMDKHSTSSSRGSSQWCQVPVYESFDYFKCVQIKESG